MLSFLNSNRSIQKNKFTARLAIDFFLLVYLALVIGLSLSWMKAGGGIRDFGSFVASGQYAAEGENPYRTDSPLIFRVQMLGNGRPVVNPNLNPPVTVFFFERVSRINPETAYRLWQWISLLLYILSITLLAARFKDLVNLRKIIWAFCLAGLWHTIELGQFYSVILLFCALGWFFSHESEDWISGLFIGIVIALKPNFAIWLLFLLVLDYKRIFVAALSSTILFSLIPVLRYGPHIYLEWINAIRNYSGWVMPDNHSITGIAYSLGVPWLASILDLAVLGLSIAAIWGRKITKYQVYSLAIITGLLISPITWPGYSILLVPYFFSQPWTKVMKFSGLVLILPMPFIAAFAFTGQSFFHTVVIGRLFGWVYILLWIEQIYYLMRSSPLLLKIGLNRA